MKWRMVTEISKSFERVSLKDDSFFRKAGVERRESGTLLTAHRKKFKLQRKKDLKKLF